MAMWLIRATAGGTCVRCGEDYARGEPVGAISGETTQGHVRVLAHPQCWLEIGLTALGEAMPKRPGRMSLSEEQRGQRRLLVRYWVELRARERMIKDTRQGDNRAWNLERIEQIREEIKQKMLGVGGIPASWL